MRQFRSAGTTWQHNIRQNQVDVDIARQDILRCRGGTCLQDLVAEAIEHAYHQPPHVGIVLNNRNYFPTGSCPIVGGNWF